MNLMDAAAIGDALSGKSARTGRRFMDSNCPIPVYLVGNRRYVARADFENWLQSRRIEPERKQRSDLKQWLDEFAEKTFAKSEARHERG